eukprot:Pgem_evm1s4332
MLAVNSTTRRADEPKEQPLETPGHFNFPYEAYKIQKDYMRILFQAIENGV